MKNPNSKQNSTRYQPRDIVVLAHNIRSIYNIGSIFRTSEGFGVKKIILSGYSPFPKLAGEKFSDTGRLPYLADKITAQIHKTALGAEESVTFNTSKNIKDTILNLKNQGYKVVALEQSVDSIKLPEFNTSKDTKIALLLGEEVNGIDEELIRLCDYTIEIPMFGRKESFNVSVAAGIALYKIACE